MICYDMMHQDIKGVRQCCFQSTTSRLPRLIVRISELKAVNLNAKPPNDNKKYVSNNLNKSQQY